MKRSVTPPGGGKPARGKYPWGDWFRSPRTLTLKRGEDFTVQGFVMAQQIRNAAYKHKVRVTVVISKEDDGKTLTVTVGPRGDG